MLKDGSALGMQTTPEMRARIRELAQQPSMDDYDRAVLLLLEDFSRCMVLLAVMSDAMKRAPYQTFLGDLNALKVLIEHWQLDAMHGLPCTKGSIEEGHRLVRSVIKFAENTGETLAA